MSGGAAYNYDSAAVASSSKTRLPAPSPLLESPRVKVELASPLQSATVGFSYLSTTDNQDARADTYNDTPLSSKLMLQPPSRPHRPLKLPPSTIHLNPNTAILYSSPQHTQQAHHQHDVPLFVNASLPNDYPVTLGQHGSLRFEQSPPQRTPVSNNASLNSSISWTSSQPVSTSALAAQHGLPQSLPPAPRTTRYLSEKSAVTSISAPNTDFSVLCANYLNMLAQKPITENPDPVVDHDSAVSAVMELFTASPEFQDLGSDFMTSPMDDSPWEDLLTTPALATGDDMFTSPAIVDADDFGFGDGSLFTDYAAAALNSAPAEPTKQQSTSRLSLPFDNMYTLSPATPSLDPSSLQPSPAVLLDHSPAPSALTRRKNAPTGTRKNITPEALVPYDAPIQHRKYLTPSATSRKEVPAVFAKKRSRSQAFGEEEEGDDDASLNPTDMDAIEAKRRQNTLAARRSRKRKLEYQRELEMGVEREKEEKEMWKQKAMFYETLLKHHGLEVPSYP